MNKISIMSNNENEQQTISEQNRLNKIWEELPNKKILDACCGGRCFWFNKNHSAAVYIDKRREEKGFSPERPLFEVQPDVIMDFRKLEFPDQTFKLIVMDPPHLLVKKCGNGIMRRKYGALDASWKEDIRKGFAECWRVLEDYGVLIFKWNEISVSIKDVLSCIPIQPLFGHPTAKHGKTKWFVFMKFP